MVFSKESTKYFSFVGIRPTIVATSRSVGATESHDSSCMINVNSLASALNSPN